MVSPARQSRLRAAKEPQAASCCALDPVARALRARPVPPRGPRRGKLRGPPREPRPAGRVAPQPLRLQRHLSKLYHLKKVPPAPESPLDRPAHRLFQAVSHAFTAVSWTQLSGLKLFGGQLNIWFQACRLQLALAFARRCGVEDFALIDKAESFIKLQDREEMVEITDDITGMSLVPCPCRSRGSKPFSSL